VDAGATERGQSRRLDECRRLRVGRTLGAPPRSEDKEADDERRDVVEKQRRDRLIDELGRAHQAGQKGPERASGKAERRHQRQQQPGRQIRKIERARGGEPGAHIELTFTADIDQTEPTRQCDRNRRQQQRRHPHQKFGEAIRVAENVNQRVAVGA